MKKPGKQKIRGNGRTSQALRVEFIHQPAKHVAITGSFSAYQPLSAPMIMMGNGQRLKELVRPQAICKCLMMADEE